MDFLPALVAPRVGVFITELGQQTHCAFFTLLSFIPCFLLFHCMMLEH